VNVAEFLDRCRPPAPEPSVDPPDPSHDDCWCRRSSHPAGLVMRWTPTTDPLAGRWGWLTEVTR